MAVKEKKTYNIDSKIAKEFQATCKQNDKKYNEVIEVLMKLYIEKQGKILLDDIYAPRLDALVGRRMDKAVDRMAGMLYETQVDILATQFLITGALKKSLSGFEDIIDIYFLDEILNPDRGSVADNYNNMEDANKLLPGARNAARKVISNDIRERKNKKEES